jgi:hypothetical protein
MKALNYIWLKLLANLANLRPELLVLLPLVIVLNIQLRLIGLMTIIGIWYHKMILFIVGMINRNTDG